MDIFDLALKYRDFEWMKELAGKWKLQEAAVETGGGFHEEMPVEDKLVTLFDKESVALEKIVTQYAVKENNGVRAFNINSDFDRIEAELVLVENTPYNIGDIVRYYVPTRDELTYMRGAVSGYYMGYREAYRDVNRDYAFIYELGKADGNKSKGGGKKNRKKASQEEKDKTKEVEL